MRTTVATGRSPAPHRRIPLPGFESGREDSRHFRGSFWTSRPRLSTAAKASSSLGSDRERAVHVAARAWARARESSSTSWRISATAGPTESWTLAPSACPNAVISCSSLRRGRGTPGTSSWRTMLKSPNRRSRVAAAPSGSTGPKGSEVWVPPSMAFRSHLRTNCRRRVPPPHSSRREARRKHLEWRTATTPTTTRRR